MELAIVMLIVAIALVVYLVVLYRARKRRDDEYFGDEDPKAVHRGNIIRGLFRS